MNEQQNNQTDFQRFLRSHTARFLFVIVITLLLMIPLAQMNFLIRERKMRAESVKTELKSEFGGEVTYHGLLLHLPVIQKSESTVVENGKAVTVVKNEVVNLFAYPYKSSDNAVSTVNEKKRGIFSLPVFRLDVSSASSFDLAKIREVNAGRDIDWKKARIVMIANLSARIKELGAISVNGRSYSPEPLEISSGNERYNVIATQEIDLSAMENKLETKMESAYNGCESITFQPLAANSSLKLTSNWSDPGFSGNSLPDSETLKLNKKGFSADFSNTNIFTKKGSLHQLNNLPDFNYSEVRFIKMVDQYQLNERTIKYGTLVLILTFAVFFLIQLVGKVSIHPLHYFMIGLALVLFYSLLLSFSEQIGFMPAYAIACTAIVLLITWYARAILNSLKFAVMSALSLSLLYAFLLVIVNLEVYALIVGSIGLLFVLIAIMSITRKLNFQES